MIELFVYSRQLVLQGEISAYDELDIVRNYTKASTLVLHVERSPTMLTLLKHRNIITTQDNPDYGFIIEHLGSVKENGKDMLEVYAYSLNKLLEAVTIPKQMRKSGNIEEMIKYFITHNAISPSNANRRITDLVLAPNTGIAITDESTQTGGDLLETSFAIGNKHDVCTDILINHETKKLEVVTWQGMNRATDQTVYPHVMFSQAFDNVTKQDYFKSYLNHKNVAVVAGEGEGEARQVVIVNDHITGDERRELYVDARDLQSVYSTESGNQVTMTPSEYTNALIKRGEEKLKEYEVVESFESTVQDTQYILGIDYNLGDRVTFEDEELGILMHVRVTSIRTLSNKEGVVHSPSFGTGIPQLR